LKQIDKPLDGLGVFEYRIDLGRRQVPILDRHEVHDRYGAVFESGPLHVMVDEPRARKRALQHLLFGGTYKHVQIPIVRRE
jgi:hypothetical protein